jgi:hypothetical protein
LLNLELALTRRRKLSLLEYQESFLSYPRLLLQT